MNGFTPPPACALLDDTPDHRADRAVTLIGQFAVALGPGHHTITCATAHPSGTLQGSLEIENGDDGFRFTGGLLSALVIVLAHAIASDGPAGIVTRSHHHDGHHDVVRGWLIADGRPEPLTAEQVKTAYGTDALTGEPLPPEPDTVYRPGLPIPDLDDANGEEGSDDGPLHPR